MRWLGLRGLWVLLAAGAVSSAVVGAQGRPQFTVYIGPDSHDGFIDMDAGIHDSIHDIQEECRARGLSVVDNRERATIALIVIGRGLPVKGDIGFGSGSAVGGLGTSFAFMMPNTVPTITTSLRIGQYQRASSREGGTWRQAAQHVTDDLIAWAEANRSALTK